MRPEVVLTAAILLSAVSVRGEVQPTCDKKQVLWGMKFPVPFCRECTGGTCFMTKLDADAERQIKDVFTGFFYSQAHLQQVDGTNVVASSRARQKRRSPGYVAAEIEDHVMSVGDARLQRMRRQSSGHDGDLHCPTILSFQNLTRLTNSYGVERELVHLPTIGEYQWVLVGECAGVDESCEGGCVEELATHFLLVWNLDHPLCPMSFEPFEVRTYCSCKNVTVK